MAVELVDRHAISVAVRRFLGMGVAGNRSLPSVMSVCIISFVELLLFLFGVFWGVCGESSCNIFMLLFMVLWVPASTMLCKRAVLMLWHAFLFLGLRFFPLFFSLLGGLSFFLL
jgi:hypothetical protein